MTPSSREKQLNTAVSLKTMETHAALTAKALTTQTESKVTRANYDHYQGHYKVCLPETYLIEMVSIFL
jgi:hypothetical protein